MAHESNLKLLHPGINNILSTWPKHYMLKKTPTPALVRVSNLVYLMIIQHMPQHHMSRDM